MPEVLLVTTATDLAADLVVMQLQQRGVPFVRFNQEEFPRDVEIAWLDAGRSRTLSVHGKVLIDPEIRSAWFRHPTKPARLSDTEGYVADFIERESAGFLAGFWETAPWFWMNRPSAAAYAGNKLHQLAYASASAFCVPKTLITNCAKAARDFVNSCDAIAKAVVGGSVDDAGRRYAVYTTPVNLDDLTDEAVRAAPMILQDRVIRDFDLRVTVVGVHVFGTRISVPNSQREVDWRAVDPAQVTYERHYLPPSIEAECIGMMKAFSLSFGAFDFVVTPQGDYIFLELNPSGQWGWLEAATGAQITDAIINKLIDGTP